MAFERLVGQPHLKLALGRSWRAGRLAHAYLFHGEEGLGAGCAALELARLVLCEGPADQAPCGACPGCAKTAVLDHPDLRLLFPLPAVPAGREDQDPAEHHAGRVLEELGRLAEDPYAAPRVEGAQQILIAQARHLRRWAGLKSYQGGRRVAIVLNAERMGPPAQNALLKLLEEPPPALLLLLAASRPQRLLPTIRSRCQALALRPVPVDELAALLAGRLPADADPGAEALARLSGGNPGRAMDLARGEEEDAAGFLRAALRRNPGEAYRLVNELAAARDREAVRRLLGAVADWLQDVGLVQALGDDAWPLVRHPHQREALARFAGRFRLRDPGRLLEETERLQRLLELNVTLFSLLVSFLQLLNDELVQLDAPASAAAAS